MDTQFGGARSSLDPNFKSGGNATDGGSKKVDDPDSHSSGEDSQDQARYYEGRWHRQWLLLMRAEAEADILAINEKQMPREKAAAIAEINNQLTIDEIEFIGTERKHAKTSC